MMLKNIKDYLNTFLLSFQWHPMSHRATSKQVFGSEKKINILTRSFFNTLSRAPPRILHFPCRWLFFSPAGVCQSFPTGSTVPRAACLIWFCHHIHRCPRAGKRVFHPHSRLGGAFHQSVTSSGASIVSPGKVIWCPAELYLCGIDSRRWYRAPLFQYWILTRVAK